MYHAKIMFKLMLIIILPGIYVHWMKVVKIFLFKIMIYIEEMILMEAFKEGFYVVRIRIINLLLHNTENLRSH